MRNKPYLGPTTLQFAAQQLAELWVNALRGNHLALLVLQEQKQSEFAQAALISLARSSSFLLLLAMPSGSFLFLVVRPGAPIVASWQDRFLLALRTFLPICISFSPDLRGPPNKSLLGVPTGAPRRKRHLRTAPLSSPICTTELVKKGARSL